MKRANGCIKVSILCAIAIVATTVLAGCSAHQDPPATPYDTARTPTFRSSVNSTDYPLSPYDTQPGLNTGHVVTLTPIPRHDRWDQNAPLALEVYGQLTSLDRNDINYVAVQSKGSAVMVAGTVPSKDIETKVLTLAHQTKGVKSVVAELTVKAP